MTAHIVKIIIADDHQLFADGLSQLLSENPNYKIIRKVGNGKQLMQVLNSSLPDLILMDINMPFLTGTDATQEIKKKYPEIKIVFVSMYTNKKLILQCKEVGANGFLSKGISSQVLVQTIAKIINGQNHFVLDDDEDEHVNVASKDIFFMKFSLTPKEIEVIHLISIGKSTKEIAMALFLSPYTIETHRKNIFRKLKLKNALELAKFARENLVC
jgi:DNA-binding NarL/FixJ family response regulator